jgi:hypothetical protein
MIGTRSNNRLDDIHRCIDFLTWGLNPLFLRRLREREVSVRGQTMYWIMFTQRTMFGLAQHF